MRWKGKKFWEVIVSLIVLIVRPCILNVVYVFLLWSMYSYCWSIYSYCCLCILIVVYVFLDAATLTEVFPCFFLGCKANAGVILAKTGHGPHFSKIVVLLYVLFVLYYSMYCLCVCVCTVLLPPGDTQLQLTNISISINKANLVHNFFSVFVCFLYMFRATMCPSSGEITVCDTWYLLFCMDDSEMQGCTLHSRQSSTQSDKYQVSHRYSYFS